ncbi:MAG TPA: AAA family ATPase [Planctomycetota bacterium]|nr:AAA family ATPase [Planctomycetota bacterium]
MTRKIKMAIINADDDCTRAIGHAAGLSGEQEHEAVELADAPTVAGYLAEQRPTVVFFGIPADAASESTAATLTAIKQFSEAGSRTAVIGIARQVSSATLLDAVRAGVDEFLTPPLNDATIRECIHNVCRKKGIIQSGGSHSGGKVFTVFSGKGGCGKTLIVTSLAHQLAQVEGRSVVVLDLNLQFGNAATFLDLQPRHTVIDCLHNDTVVEDEVLMKMPCRHASGVAVISGPEDPADSEQFSPEHTHALVEALKRKFDYVVIDTLSNFDDHNLTALDMADRIVLVTDTLVPSVRNTQRCLKVFSKLNYDPAKIVLVVNRLDKSVGAGAKELQQAFHTPIEVFIPNEFSTVMSAVDAGQPIADTAQKSAVVDAVRQLVQCLVEENSEQPQQRQQNWLRKFSGGFISGMIGSKR